MSARQILIGHGRNTLFTAVTSAVASGASVDFGAFNVEKYSRFTGLASAVGSFTLRYRLAINSGTWIVASAFTVNSGGSVFDVLNPGGKVADFGITIANSQVFTIGVLGEPVR